MNTNYVAENKQLRKDLDTQLQIVKNSSRKSRERSLAITKLQEAIMWLGMDLKAINEENPQPVPSADDNAKAAYHRYGSVTGFKNFRGDPMPEWENLGDAIQKAWIAASGTKAAPLGNPYPESYNPASPVIEPTADGLKL